MKRNFLVSKLWQKITAVFLCGGLAVVCIFLLRFEQEDIRTSLSDAFSLVGVGILTISALEFLKDKGALLGVEFALKSVKAYFFPFGNEKREKYGEYRARKLADTSKFPRIPFLIVGFFYFILAFMII